jgi:hypothetical protein
MKGGAAVRALVSRSKPLGILAGAIFFVIWFLKPVFWPAYDTAHPDYQRLTESLGEHEIDLSRLNDGNWQIACVFGGYTDPVSTLAKMEAPVSVLDAVRLWNYRGFPIRLGAVEEEEAVVAYVDGDRRTHFILIEKAVTNLEHFSNCIERPETHMILTS